MTRSVRAGGLAAAAFVAALFAGAAPAQAQTAPIATQMVIAPAAAQQIPASATPAVQVVAQAPGTVAVPDAPAVLTVQPLPVPAPHQASLEELASTLAATDVAAGDQECLAVAVYFESRGEPLAGQLAVAEVVLNRARSGRYPPDVCAVVKQKAQFSFVRHGQFPSADRSSDAWRRAVAISRIAQGGLAAQLPQSVLWYHADYVAPSWGKNLRRQAKIGQHIFYS